MLGNDTHAADEIVESTLEVKPSVADVGEALDAVARRHSPIRYYASTVLFLSLASVIVWLVSDDESAQAPFRLYLACMWILLIPWIRHRVAALVFKWGAPGHYREYTIVRFSRHAMYVLERGREIEEALGDFPIRLETKHTFTWARANASLGFVVPKRAFGDAAKLAAFRRIVEAPAPSAAVVAAVRALGADEPADTIRFTPEPSEALRGVKLMMGEPSYRLGQALLAALVVLGFGAYFRATGAEAGIFMVIVVLLVVYRASARRRKRADAGELTVTVELGETVRRRSVAGSTEWKWSDFHALVEDEKVVVLRAGQGGLCIPKRSLPSATLDLMRARTPDRRAPA